MSPIAISARSTSARHGRHQDEQEPEQAITLAADVDETARLIKGAKTDSERHITYDPVTRPEVSSLLLLAARCQNRAPEQVAADIGPAGAAALKKVVTESVNEYLAPIRARRTEYGQDAATSARRCARATSVPERWPTPLSPRCEPP
ncbi:hypothetical protein ACIG87_29030 [Micromonospora sp. NPDC051925]|uniref:hypothetical protein n=1 Tax=Micromonospora sp. NPDC051925 TaxID=3364288 RepID=UPI0037C5D8F9